MRAERVCVALALPAMGWTFFAGWLPFVTLDASCSEAKQESHVIGWVGSIQCRGLLKHTDLQVIHPLLTLNSLFLVPFRWFSPIAAITTVLQAWAQSSEQHQRLSYDMPSLVRNGAWPIHRGEWQGRRPLKGGMHDLACNYSKVGPLPFWVSATKQQLPPPKFEISTTSTTQSIHQTQSNDGFAD